MQVWCDWQLTLCDPHLSALEVRFHDDALYKSMFTFTFTFLTALECTKFVFVGAPDPAGELTVLPQIPYSWFKGPTSKGRGLEVKGKKGRKQPHLSIPAYAPETWYRKFETAKTIARSMQKMCYCL